MTDISKWKLDAFGLNKLAEDERKKKTDELRQREHDYQAVFGTEAGQRVFWDMIEQTYVFQPYFHQNASAYVKEGRREIGLYLLASVGFTPDAQSLSRLVEMFKQATIKEK